MMRSGPKDLHRTRNETTMATLLDASSSSTFVGDESISFVMVVMSMYTLVIICGTVLSSCLSQRLHCIDEAILLDRHRSMESINRLFLEEDDSSDDETDEVEFSGLLDSR